MDLFNTSASRLSVKKINTAKKNKKHCKNTPKYIAYPKFVNKIKASCKIEWENIFNYS